MHPDDRRPQVFVGRFLFLGLAIAQGMRGVQIDSQKLLDAPSGGKEESQM
ncbi:hypothetical protein [Coleofasciculus sp. H7-2]